MAVSLMLLGFLLLGSDSVLGSSREELDPRPRKGPLVHGLVKEAETGAKVEHWKRDTGSSGIPAWMKDTGKAYNGYPSQVTCALKPMSEAYHELKARRYQNCDQYFRCQGSKKAAKCGLFSKLLASAISYDYRWRTAGLETYTSAADEYGRKGGDCLNKYYYDTLTTEKVCWLPWQLQE
ncbi:predicted protein [Nematostella vectensis]|uniref:Uncharacterized protein n=1 Tax=Nematostella vectensis TaxID=45351 RepID=A7RQ49_NEMVE|nr:uncharacterized protein LOC5518558 [Nematostella vectensis]EDO46498.1 predicted protein [Nematostella vectensis]|eukprot:XP_001638561.1 predicted protein [Nematostella vectensis]